MADAYGTLVRDEVPAIIAADGDEPVTHVADRFEETPSDASATSEALTRR